MIREQRYKEILKIIEKEEIISVDKLSTSLNIPLTS